MPAYDDRHYVPPAPVARVVVRHPDREKSVGDVPMLIDSGADATLLPRSAATSLGLEVTGERYQLVGFDGTISERSWPLLRLWAVMYQLVGFDGTISESEAVLASLAFLRWNFRGRFLLTDADVGVIGRDILNHVRLLLDGPALHWEEHA